VLSQRKPRAEAAKTVQEPHQEDLAVLRLEAQWDSAG
jgi:hypothetical protein